MSINEAKNNIGKMVIYKPYDGCPNQLWQTGKIKSVNEKYVFVLYNHNTIFGEATKPEDLTLF
jgi:hypothetical protein